MRLYCVAMLAGALASTGASASSFVTLPARSESASPSFVYLGGAQSAVASAPAPEAPPLAALSYPAPLSAALTAPDAPIVVPAPPAPRIALHYPAPFPADLKTPNASAPIVKVSTSVIAMGEPEIEYFKVAAITPKPRPRPPQGLSPMVMRGGITGDAISRDSGMPGPGEQPRQASARPEKQKPVPRDTKPTPEPAVAPPPPPPKGMGPLRGVQ